MQAKKSIYILLAMFLGLLLSFLFVAALQISYFRSMSDYAVSGVCESCMQESFMVESPVFVGVAAAVGIVGGYFLGQKWWQVVYVEKRHWSRHIRRKKAVDK